MLRTRTSETVTREDNLLEQQPGRGVGSCSCPAVVGGTSRGWSRGSEGEGTAEQSRSLRARQGCGRGAEELQWGRWEEGLLEEFPVQSGLRALGHRVSPSSGLRGGCLPIHPEAPSQDDCPGLSPWVVSLGCCPGLSDSELHGQSLWACGCRGLTGVASGRRDASTGTLY